MKNISFLSEFFQFLEVKFSIYLNRRVFVMPGLNFNVYQGLLLLSDDQCVQYYHSTSYGMETIY